MKCVVNPDTVWFIVVAHLPCLLPLFNGAFPQYNWFIFMTFYVRINWVQLLCKLLNIDWFVNYCCNKLWISFGSCHKTLHSTCLKEVYISTKAKFNPSKRVYWFFFQSYNLFTLITRMFLFYNLTLFECWVTLLTLEGI